MLAATPLLLEAWYYERTGAPAETAFQAAQTGAIDWIVFNVVTLA